ncbi:MAG: serine/threonine-protein kinase [Sandaracinaceae bacterium]
MIAPPFDPAELPPGTRLSGKYRLGPVIGAGMRSVVYLATHELLGRTVAVKVLAPGRDVMMERLFAREARHVSALAHPNIVEVYELGRLPDGRPYLVMEYLDGETVRDRMQREGLFSISAAVAIGRQVLDGLGAAHEKRIVHLDLRPENLSLVKVRGAEVVKILDFGISRRFGTGGDSILKTRESLLEHVTYVAPEQLFDEGVIDHRADIYSTGMLLYVMLTGTSPYDGRGAALVRQVAWTKPEPPSRLRPALTSEIDRVLLCALSKDPVQRFASAEEMGEALRLAALFADYLADG